MKYVKILLANEFHSGLLKWLQVPPQLTRIAKLDLQCLVSTLAYMYVKASDSNCLLIMNDVYCPCEI